MNSDSERIATQDERRVMLEPFPDMPMKYRLHFANLHCENFGCEEATPAEAKRFRRDNTPTEAKGDGG